MESFWICFVALGLVFVPAISLFVIAGSTWGSKIGGVIVCVLFWFAATGVMYTQDKRDNEMWNNGVCSVCEGEYNFSGASESRTSHHYYYTCDDCGHTIKINRLMK